MCLILWNTSLISLYPTFLVTYFDDTEIFPLSPYPFCILQIWPLFLDRLLMLLFLFFPITLLCNTSWKREKQRENLKKRMTKENKICPIYSSQKPHTGNGQFEKKLITLILTETQIASRWLSFCFLIYFEWFDRWAVESK